MHASEFGAALRDRRLAAGLTQEELAQRATLSVRTISSLEHGFGRPYLKTVRLLAEALGLTGTERDEFLRAARPGARVPAQAARPDPAVPRQLPPAPADFTGRAAELKMLAALVEDGAGGQTAIAAISGTAGVGKTALAVYWAHQVTDCFPDGQLYVNLRGYDPEQPMAAEDALAGFLRALGVPGQDIPAELEERAARYRTLLAPRRMLIVLDNAGSAQQVRSLLPGTGACAVVATSRDTLAGLVARDGARRLDLELMPPADADVLLTRLIGDRAAADPRTTSALAGQCARLPLALRVAAELAVARSGVSLATLAAELGDQQRRMDLLDVGGDPRTSVRSVFSWSYRHLDDATARAFRLIGLHPGPDLEPYAVAALTGGTAEQARQWLVLLARAHLIQPAGSDRYTVHDLLRSYARERAASHDGADQGRAALTRLFDYYLAATAAAVDTMLPAERERRPSLPPPGTPVPRLATLAAARAWLDTQRPALVAMAAHTAEHGWPGHTTLLATIVSPYLENGGHSPEISSVHAYARRAARSAGDPVAEAKALNSLSSVFMRQGHYQDAIHLLEQALDLHRATGNELGQARALANIGIATFLRGHYDRAIAHYEQALTGYRRAGDRIGEARTLNNLGLVGLRQGRYQQATGHLGRALALGGEIDDPTSTVLALANLGVIDGRQSRYEQAGAHLMRAVTLSRQVGHSAGEAYALTALATLDRQQGRYDRAVDQYRQAVSLCQEASDPSGETEARNGIGAALLAAGQPGRALQEYASALGLANEIGEKHGQADAHAGLGQVHQALGDPGQAREHWREALALYTDMGMLEAEQVRASLNQDG